MYFTMPIYSRIYHFTGARHTITWRHRVNMITYNRLCQWNKNNIIPFYRWPGCSWNTIRRFGWARADQLYSLYDSVT